MHAFSRCVVALFVGAVVGSHLAAQLPQKDDTPRPSYRSAPEPQTPLGAAWQQFLAEDQGGTWWSRWSAATGTPREIWGSGIALPDWRGDNLLEARRQAERFVHDHKELLALGSSEFRERTAARMGQTWVFVYDQYFRGVPVIGGRADVRVHGVGRVPMFGSTAWQIPADFSVIPALDQLEATRLAWLAMNAPVSTAKQPGKPRAPQLVIWGNLLARELQTAWLCWEIPISNVDADGTGPIGRYYVDATTGAVRHYENDKLECGLDHNHAHAVDLAHEHAHAHDDGADHIPQGQGQNPGKPSGSASLVNNYTATGRVLAQTRTGLSSTSAITTVPLAGALITAGSSTAYTDANGYYSITWSGLFSFTTAVFGLDGRHNAAMSGTNSPAVTRAIFAGANTDTVMNAPSDLEAAHTTTYYWIYSVNEWSRSILGNSAELNTADGVAPTVNIANTCNAYYTGNTVNFYQAGGSCRNTAFSTIITHEWGHGLDDRYGGISNSAGDGLSEGWGDIIGTYHADDPIVGNGFYTNGNSLRTGNNTAQYPPANEVHAAGQVWMGFAWQLRERLAITLGTRASAITLSNDIVVGSIVADAVDQLGAYLQVYVADDNDGNLANLTPHATEIKWAGDQKSYPYPLAAVPSNDECSGAIELTNSTSWGPYDNSAALDSDPSWACTGFGSKDLWFKYLAGNGPLTITTCGLAAFDTVIQVFSGTCGALTSVACNDDACSFQSSVTVNVTTPGYYYIRVGGYNNRGGTFQLSVQGTLGNLATRTSFGKGCPTISRAFYELTSAAAFDLNLSAIRLTRSGSTYNVASIPASGVFRVPSLASVLVLTDDGETTVTLPGTLSFPGGTTTALTVCSNGFLSSATGNGTGYAPSASGFVASPAARWGTWHDFNPTATGSGLIKYEQLLNVAYFTWDGVYDFGTSNRNTWQIQFDLTTGNVTMVWPLMSGTGNSILVGFTPPGPNPDPGTRDLTATMPFSTNATNVFPLTVATALDPVLGTTVPITTTHYPPTTTFGVLLESLIAVNPGTDLSSLGMTGCFGYAGQPNVSVLQFPGLGQSVFNQAIPNVPNFMGIRLTVQSFAFASGYNAAGIVSSNGITLTVGF